MSKGSRILIVEDEMVISIEIAQTLRRLGYDVVGQAVSGTDAIRLAEELDPDLILMDIRLQGNMDGIEAAARIKEKISRPVVFLTAHSDEATLERAIAISPSGYLIKPFKDRELYSTIELSLHKYDIWQRIRPERIINDSPGCDIFDIPGVCMVIISSRGIVSRINKDACSLFGAGSADICGTRITGWISSQTSLKAVNMESERKQFSDDSPHISEVIMPGCAVLHSHSGTDIPVRIETGFITSHGFVKEYILSLYLQS